MQRDILAFMPHHTMAKSRIMAIVDRGNSLEIDAIATLNQAHKAVAICSMLNHPDDIFGLSGLWHSLPTAIKANLEQAEQRLVGQADDRHDLALISIAELDLPEPPDPHADIDWAKLFPSAGCSETGCDACEGCPGHAKGGGDERTVNLCAPGGSCSCHALGPDDELCACVLTVIGPRWAAALYQSLAETAGTLHDHADSLVWGAEDGGGFPHSLCAQPPQFYVQMAESCANLCAELQAGRDPVPPTIAEFLMLDEAARSHLQGWTGDDGLDLETMKQEMAHLPESFGDFDLETLWMFQITDSD